MKKLMFLALGFLVFALSMVAQDAQQGGMRRGNMSPEERVKMRVERLNQQLNLTESQKQKVDSLYTEQEAQMKKMRDQQAGDREQMRANIQKIREENNAKMKDILTPEQYTKFTEMNQNMRQGRGIRQLQNNE